MKNKNPRKSQENARKMVKSFSEAKKKGFKSGTNKLILWNEISFPFFSRVFHGTVSCPKSMVWNTQKKNKNFIEILNVKSHDSFAILCIFFGTIKKKWFPFFGILIYLSEKANNKTVKPLLKRMAQTHFVSCHFRVLFFFLLFSCSYFIWLLKPRQIRYNHFSYA